MGEKNFFLVSNVSVQLYVTVKNRTGWPVVVVFSIPSYNTVKLR